MDIQEINRAIMFGNLTNDELTSIGDAIRYRRSRLTQEKKRDLFVGLSVKFTNSRNGKVVVGTVSKINRKFVIVREAPQAGGFFSTQWRVPANMLEEA